MSDSNVYQQWCDEAKHLLGNIHATTFEYNKSLTQADGLLQQGQPPEMADEDWQGLQHYVTEAQAGFQSKSQTKNAKKKLKSGGSIAPTDAQQKSMELLRSVMQTIATDTKTKKDALAKLRAQHKIEDSLDATGLAEIARLDDPAAAFATVLSLKSRIQNALTTIQEPRLAKLVPVNLTGKAPEAEQKVKALDLDGAQEVVETLEAGVTAAEAELKALLALQKTLTNDQVTELKLDGVRKLLKLQEKFTQIKDTYVQVIAGVRQEVAKAEKSKIEAERQSAKSRKDQCDAIERDFPEIIDQWPKLSPKDKVGDNGRISVGRLESRLESVGRKPAGPPPVDPAAAALLQQQKLQWAAFRNDVIAKWQAYENSGFDPALRGPFPSNGVLTPHVRTRCVFVQKVSISGRVYRCSPSITAGLSMKTPLPPPYTLNTNNEPIMSFIYHLPLV